MIRPAFVRLNDAAHSAVCRPLEEIIRSILAGNSEDFREIIREFGDDLLKIAYHFVHDWDEAKDITQTTFIACYRNLRRYHPARPFRPWLLRIHLNNCRSAHRRHRRRLLRETVLDETTEDATRIDNGNDEAIIWRQIDRLSAKQKAAFVLVEIESYSSHDAAEILGCTDSTVRVHLARAKRKLREQLKYYGIGYE